MRRQQHSSSGLHARQNVAAAPHEDAPEAVEVLHRSAALTGVHRFDTAGCGSSDAWPDGTAASFPGGRTLAEEVLRQHCRVGVAVIAADHNQPVQRQSAHLRVTEQHGKGIDAKKLAQQKVGVAVVAADQASRPSTGKCL